MAASRNLLYAMFNEMCFSESACASEYWPMIDTWPMIGAAVGTAWVLMWIHFAFGVLALTWPQLVGAFRRCRKSFRRCRKCGSLAEAVLETTTLGHTLARSVPPSVHKPDVQSSFRRVTAWKEWVYAVYKAVLGTLAPSLRADHVKHDKWLEANSIRIEATPMVFGSHVRSFDNFVRSTISTRRSRCHQGPEWKSRASTRRAACGTAV